MTDFLPFQAQLEDTECEDERNRADAESDFSGLEGMAGACLIPVARSDVSCSTGKIPAPGASLPVDPWSNSWITQLGVCHSRAGTCL